jgi:hypothetical protein
LKNADREISKFWVCFLSISILSFGVCFCCFVKYFFFAGEPSPVNRSLLQGIDDRGRYGSIINNMDFEEIGTTHHGYVFGQDTDSYSEVDDIPVAKDMNTFQSLMRCICCFYEDNSENVICLGIFSHCKCLFTFLYDDYPSGSMKKKKCYFYWKKLKN